MAAATRARIATVCCMITARTIKQISVIKMQRVSESGRLSDQREKASSKRARLWRARSCCEDGKEEK